MDLETIFRVNSLCLSCKKFEVDDEGKYYCSITNLRLIKKENEKTCKFEDVGLIKI